MNKVKHDRALILYSSLLYRLESITHGGYFTTAEINKVTISKSELEDIIVVLKDLLSIREHTKKLQQFISSQEELPPEFSKILQDNYWDLLE